MSSVTSRFSTAVTGVFWDLDGCPIPVGLSPASIYDNIKLALNNMGYTGALSISAYSLKKLNEEDSESASINLVQPGSGSAKRESIGDVSLWGLKQCNAPTNLNEEDFESAGIKLCCLGSGSAKRESMFVDLYGWGLKHRYEPTNLMLISKNISEDLYYVRALLNLKEKENNILLAQPDNPVGVLRGIPSSFWLWTSLSTGGSPLDSQSGSSEVVVPSPTSSPRSGTSLRLAKKKKMKRPHKTQKSTNEQNVTCL